MTSLLLRIWRALKLPTNWQLFFMRRVNDQFLVGVTGIFLADNGKVLLFKHTYRQADKWRLPGGYIKGKEHPKEGIEREVKEESGLIVSADKRLRVRTDRHTSRLDIVYVGKFIGGDFEPSEEVNNVKLFAFDELPRLPKDQLFFIEKALQSESNS
jgi:8-oxo-dGTP diphosphatase